MFEGARLAAAAAFVLLASCAGVASRGYRNEHVKVAWDPPVVRDGEVFIDRVVVEPRGAHVEHLLVVVFHDRDGDRSPGEGEVRSRLEARPTEADRRIVARGFSFPEEPGWRAIVRVEHGASPAPLELSMYP